MSGSQFSTSNEQREAWRLVQTVLWLLEIAGKRDILAVDDNELPLSGEDFTDSSLPGLTEVTLRWEKVTAVATFRQQGREIVAASLIMDPLRLDEPQLVQIVEACVDPDGIGNPDNKWLARQLPFMAAEMLTEALS